jgi:hypothetical protein
MAGDPFFVQNLVSAKAAGTLFNTYTTAKTVINQTDLVTLPANFLYVGRTLNVKVRGAISNVVTATPTFTFQIMMGSIAAWSSGAITTNATANTLLPFSLDVDLRTDSIGTGTTAKFLGIGTLMCAAFASGSTAINVPVASPAVGTGFDSTIANILDFFVGISASNGSNGVQIYNYRVDLVA